MIDAIRLQNDSVDRSGFPVSFTLKYAPLMMLARSLLRRSLAAVGQLAR